jgi:predicted Ser/Thr protein kinase
MARVACPTTDEELWSGIDRASLELARHLEECPSCRARAAEYRSGIEAISASGHASGRERRIPLRIGGYSILRVLGEGGMGVVYEGRQEWPERPVAVKLVRGGETLDELRVRLFQREAQMLAHLRHPRIAAIYDAGWTEDHEPYLVMELVRGRVLTEYAQSRSLSLRARLALFRRVCEPVAYAHQRGVIHRDLKPSNILIEEEGEPKILDFGLARMTDVDGSMQSTITGGENLMGTLPYMSPEEVRGQPYEVDVRSDVYSLGVILYELVSGQLPYTVSRRALHEAVQTICEVAPRKPSTIDRALAGDVETIILKALAKEPAARYQGVAEFSEDIQRLLADQPIRARRPSVAYRLRKLMVRQRRALVLIVVLFVAVAGSMVWIDQTQTELHDLAIRQQEANQMTLALEALEAARVLHAQGAYDQAEPRYRRAISLLRDVKTMGGRDRATLKAEEGLGALLVERGDPTFAPQGVNLLRSVLRRLEDKPVTEPQHVAIVQGLIELGEAEQFQLEGHFDAAARSFTDALARLEPYRGDQPLYTARAKLGWAALLMERRDAPSCVRAAEALHDAQHMYDTVLRRGHPAELDLCRVLRSILDADQSWQAGAFGKAVDAYREALALCAERLGTNHRYTQWTRIGLAGALLRVVSDERQLPAHTPPTVEPSSTMNDPDSPPSADPPPAGGAEGVPGAARRAEEHVIVDGAVHPLLVEARELLNEVVEYCDASLAERHPLHLAALEVQTRLYGPQGLNLPEHRDDSAGLLENLRAHTAPAQ